MTGSDDALRLTVLATHPIQYHAPWFRALAAEPGVELQVLFEFIPDASTQGEGFSRAFRWDAPVLDGYDFEVLGADGARRRRLDALWGLRARLARRRPDAVLLTGWHSTVLLAAPALAHAAGAAVLVRGESNLERPRAAWRRAAHRVLLSRYDRFLAIGRRNRAFYLAHGVAPASIVDCPYLVDNAWFRDRAAACGRDAARRRFGVAHGALCVLFAGKLEAKKRPLDLIAALRRLGDLPVHLLVAGSGALEADVRRAAAGLPVTFAGFLNQSEIPAAYAAADCLALPSDHGETWGLVVNEAMACARPAIVSEQVGCAPDLVIPGETGWVHPVGDVGALAACIRAACASRRRLAAMGERARERVFREHGAQGAAAATVAAVRAVARRGARAAA